MGGMEKTTVYLTSGQKAALVRAAADQGRSEARLIREGIDAITAPHRAGEALAPVAPSEQPSLERPRWIARDAFVALLRAQADAGLRHELQELAPGTTDDEPLA